MSAFQTMQQFACLKKIKITLGTIQVLPQQKGGWVGSESGNFCRFTVLFMLTSVGGLKKSQKHDDVILECSLKKRKGQKPIAYQNLSRE